MQAPHQNEVLAALGVDNNRPRMARNGVACSAAKPTRRAGFGNPSGISDSKHTNAAALAVELASNSSWSETFSPSDTSTQGSINETSMKSQGFDHSRDYIVPDHTDLGPPPEYSCANEHDLTIDSDDSESNPENMRHSSPQRDMVDPTRLTYSDAESDLAQDIDAPLLGEGSEKSPEDRSPGMRTSGFVSFRQHRLRWLRAVLGLVVLFLAGILLGYSIVGRQDASSHRNLPLIPTEKFHVQHETYEDIRGRFRLYEKLELSTTTGTIDIQIDLQPGDGTAELILSSSTGAIRLGISESWWSRGTARTLRPVHTEIKTVTGSVYGRILLGQGGYTSVDSVTGEQDLRIYVYDASSDDEVSELITRSHTGTQVVALTHLGDPDATINSLKAEHHSLGTASLDLQYSHAWRGEVHAVSFATGNLEVHRDMDLIFDKNEVREVVAHKGKGIHQQTIDAVTKGTGSVSFKSFYTW